jgi:hypothetical protein
MVGRRVRSPQGADRMQTFSVRWPVRDDLELMYRFPAVLMERADVPDGMKALSLSSKP